MAGTRAFAAKYERVLRRLAVGTVPSPQPSPSARGSQFFYASTAPVLRRGLWPPWPSSEKPLPVEPLTPLRKAGKYFAPLRFV